MLHHPTNLNEAIKLAGRLETESPHVQNVVIVRSFELLRPKLTSHDGGGAPIPKS